MLLLFPLLIVRQRSVHLKQAFGQVQFDALSHEINSHQKILRERDFQFPLP